MIDPHAAVAVHDELDSTNAEAQRRAERGEAGPLWLRARLQTAGRGRRGRRWISSPGNLFCTYLGATDRPPARLALLGFTAAVAVAETIESLVPKAPLALKWPNDVLLSGAKAAGVLLESGARDGGGLWFALGIGINVMGAPDAEELGVAAASLAGIGAQADPQGVFDALRPRLAHWARRLEAEGFDPVRAAWSARGPAHGARLQVRAGAEEAAGAFNGLAEDGALLLRLDSGVIQAFAAGEVLSPLQERAPC